MKILIIWDDQNEADLLRLYMSAGDHEATLAPTGAAALELALK